MRAVPDPSTRSDGRAESALLALTRSPSSVGAARRFIEARAAAWSLPEPTTDQLVLIGSELVTNAVLHARTELTLTLELRDGRVRISVTDRSQAPATLRHYRADAFTGRGLGGGRRPQRPLGGERRRRRQGRLGRAGRQRRPPRRHPARTRPAPRPPRDAGARRPGRPHRPVRRRPGRRLPGPAGPQRRPVPRAGADQHRARGRRRRPGRGPPGRPRRPALPALPGPARQLPRRRGRRPGARRPDRRAGDDRAAGRRRRGPELPGPARAGRRAVPLRPPAHLRAPAHVRSLRRWFVEEMAAQLLDGASPTPPRRLGPWPPTR